MVCKLEIQTKKFTKYIFIPERKAYNRITRQLQGADIVTASGAFSFPDKPKNGQKEKLTLKLVKPNVSCASGDKYGDCNKLRSDVH